MAVEQLDADIVCLQEVRKVHRREAEYFQPLARVCHSRFPGTSKATTAVYRTNAYTRHGEHRQRHVVALAGGVATSTKTCRTTASSSAVCCIRR